MSVNVRKKWKKDEVLPFDGGIAKHASPIHPGTGTDQSVHGKTVTNARGDKQGLIFDDSPASPAREDERKFAEGIFEAKLRLPDGREYEAVVTGANNTGTHLGVAGEIRDSAGKNMGEFVRRITGETVINQEFNMIARGEGIGTMFLSHWEDELAAAGITEAKVSATSIGRYAWAIAGYDWVGEQGSHSWLNGAKQVLHLHQDDPPERFRPGFAILSRYNGPKHQASWDELEILVEDWDDTGMAPAPLDFALIGSSRPVADSHFGKDLMLHNESWTGRKELKIRKNLDDARAVWRMWALEDPAAVENDDPEFLEDMRATYPDRVQKSGVLSPGFGSKRKRRNQLVQRLKSTRRYAPPVRGGKKKKRRSKLAQNLIRRRKGGKRF